MDKTYQLYNISVKGILRFKDEALATFDVAHQKWSLPGGRVDDGESIQAALERELKEEIGFNKKKLDNVFIGFNSNIAYKSRKYGIETLMYFFVLKVDEKINVILNEEHDKYMWVKKDEINNLEFIEEEMKNIILQVL